MSENIRVAIDGPSGAGKSTVVFKAIEERENVCFSTSVTNADRRAMGVFAVGALAWPPSSLATSFTSA